MHLNLIECTQPFINVGFSIKSVLVMQRARDRCMKVKTYVLFLGDYPASYFVKPVITI